MVQSLVLLTSFVFIFVNFITDLVNAWLDPRIRYQ
jgi:ABC-type dipeptide/oligopeptide/nickel transport system permease component